MTDGSVALAAEIASKMPCALDTVAALAKADNDTTAIMTASFFTPFMAYPFFTLKDMPIISYNHKRMEAEKHVESILGSAR